MSDIWTIEDAKELESARIDRLRFVHPSAWQGIFHSDWQLASQGDSPWLSTIQRQRVAPSSDVFLYICGPKADMVTFVPHAGRAAKAEMLFDKCLNLHLKPIRRAGPEQSNKWALFVYDCKHRSASESAISEELSEAARASLGILRLQDDWDGEGSPGYSEVTFNRVTSFLVSSALQYWSRHHKRLRAPRILPGPHGNIDLHWKTPQRELLISIPADPAEPAAYYGDDKEDGTDNAIRGKSLVTSQYNEWIFSWLMR